MVDSIKVIFGAATDRVVNHGSVLGCAWSPTDPSLRSRFGSRPCVVPSPPPVTGMVTANWSKFVDSLVFSLSFGMVVAVFEALKRHWCGILLKVDVSQL